MNGRCQSQKSRHRSNSCGKPLVFANSSRQWKTGPPVTSAGPLAPTLARDYRQVRVWTATKATLVLLERP